MTGPWRLSVVEGQAVSPHVPLALRIDRLVSWHRLAQLSSYPGRATYETDVDVPTTFLRADLGVSLELGEVYEVARVTINGRDAGIAWVPPFRLEVTGMLRAGPNTLHIEVANLLKNHLSGGEDRRPSGLLGPVHLRPIHRSPAQIPKPKQRS